MWKHKTLCFPLSAPAPFSAPGPAPFSAPGPAPFSASAPASAPASGSPSVFCPNTQLGEVQSWHTSEQRGRNMTHKYPRWLGWISCLNKCSIFSSRQVSLVRRFCVTVTYGYTKLTLQTFKLQIGLVEMCCIYLIYYLLTFYQWSV